MASYRRPKGIVVRHIPDWNSNWVGFSSLFAGGTGTSTQTLGLFNNANDGSYFVVWDCTMSIGPVVAASVPLGNAVWQIAKAPITGFTDPCAPINPMSPMGTPYGLIVSGFNTSGIDPNAAVYQSLDDIGTWVWPHDWPMCVVPVGYSLIATYGLTNAQASFSVMFEVVTVAN